jgi:hypothetical protein
MPYLAFLLELCRRKDLSDRLFSRGLYESARIYYAYIRALICVDYRKTALLQGAGYYFRIELISRASEGNYADFGHGLLFERYLDKLGIRLRLIFSTWPSAWLEE